VTLSDFPYIACKCLRRSSTILKLYFLQPEPQSQVYPLKTFMIPGASRNYPRQVTYAFIGHSSSQCRGRLIVIFLKLSTLCILAVNHFFLFQLYAHNMFNTYVYHLLTSYMFQCLLHHLQGDYYVICSRTVCYLRCCYKVCATKCKVYPVS